MKLLAGLKSLIASRSVHHPARSQSRRRMFFEPLEARRVLATDLASISGTVFSDQTDDGLTGDDIRIELADVHLYQDGGNGTFESAGGIAGGDDTFIGTDSSDISGEYQFDRLSAGTYFVEEEVPAGLIIRPGEDVSTVVVSAADATGIPGVLVDDFSATNQTATADSGTPSAPNSVSATEALGGERDLLATYGSGPFDVELMSSTSTSSLIIDSGTGTTGDFNVTWDGIDMDATNLDATGLGSQDFTSLGVADRLQFFVRADVPGAMLTLNVYTDAANFSSFTTTIPTGPLTEFLIPFTSFSPMGSGADFADVGAIEMVVTGVPELNAELTLVGSIGTTDQTVNFANFEPLTLGNLVFNDLNNNGTFEAATESGISGVAVSLYSDTDSSGDFTPGTDALVDTTTTDGTGVYQFTSLFPGDYIVQLDESNFNAGNALEGLLSSNGNAPTPDPDDDVNNDDNGDALTGEGIVSAAITLLPNTESITDGDMDPDTNQALDFGVFEDADLSVTKTVDNASPNVGDNVTFTITVANAGPGSGTNITIGDVLPAGLTYVSDTPSQGTYDDLTGVWTVGTIASGGNATLAITASVDTTGTKSNTAEVTAVDQPDTDSTPNNNLPAEDDQDNADLTPQVADLSLTKTVSNSTPNVGDNVTFTIVTSNAGPDDANNVTVGDTLPAGMTYVSDLPSQGTYDDTTGVWTVGTITSGSTATLQIVASVDSIGTKTNIAEVTAADQADTDSTPNNSAAAEDDQGDAAVTPQVADLSLTKIVSNATPNVGDNVTFTITASNAGPDAATNVTVSDLLPAGMTFVSDTPSQGTYNSATGVWSVGTIADGGNESLQLVAAVDTIGTKTNTAQVTAADQADSDSTPNNSVPTEDDQTSVSLTPQVADLSLTKTVSNATPNVGDNVTFTITASNAGPDAATNVTVGDLLPAGVTFVSDAPSQGTYNSATGVWSVGTVADGGNETLQLVVSVDTIGTKTNTAQIIAADQIDSDSTPNNSVAMEDDQDSAAVTPLQIDLGITKTAAPTTVTLGGTLTYTLTVTNNGPDAATGVSVVDTLPAGVTFNSATPSQGTASQASGTVTAALGTIASGGSATITIIVTPTTTNATAGTVTNSTTVSANEFDTDSANNTAQVTAAVDFLMASIAGSVYDDGNNNGVFEPTESGIANVTIRLTGTDVRGAAVDITMQTAADGSYLFDNLNPGTYQLQETQPAGFSDGVETLGTGATATAGQDLFQMIDLVDAAMAQAFNFGEGSQLSKRRFLASSSP